MKVVLQRLLAPKPGICTEEILYYGRDGALHDGENLRFQWGNTVRFDTYFNGFSYDKWKQYTRVGRITLVLRLCGSFRILLAKNKLSNGQAVETILCGENVCCEQEQEFRFDYPDDADGVLFFTLQALADGGRYAGGWYETEVPGDALRPVKLALAICTFRREAFVTHNVASIRAVQQQESSPLHGHLEVFISDNGQTLDVDAFNDDLVHLFPNSNTGGSGGFSRCMIEILKANERGAGITHTLVMDDDIILDTSVLERTYQLLALRKPEYEEGFVGGAMMRLDRPYIQVENGSCWYAGKLVSHKTNYDMREVDYCVLNEVNEHNEYNAWWYCCIPMTVIRPDNLPMPIFIRGDDVEYGLRNCRKLMTLNGICVWHEPFESKYASSMYYYILRNQCIDNALHYPSYSKEDLKADLHDQVMGEVNRYRYKNVDLLIRGVRDFLKGVDFIRTTDATALHKEIMAYGYKMLPQDQLEIPFDCERYRYAAEEEENTIGLRKRILMKLSRNGYLLPTTRADTVVPVVQMSSDNAYRVQKVLNYDLNSEKGFVTERDKAEYKRCVREMKACMKEIDAKFDTAAADFRDNQKELQSLEFWKKYLGLAD